MRIVSLDPNPIAEIPYLNAGKGPGNFYEDKLPILTATVDRLPQGVSAILATGDLQFRERFEDSDGGPIKLLGEVLPKRLKREILPKLDFPTGEVGVFLVGDLYTVPALDRRGGSGDVTEVWEAFLAEFDWVAGVAGNHDLFGEYDKPPAWLVNLGKAHYLDGYRANRPNLKMGGVGGIIGNPSKPQRKTETHYLNQLENLLFQSLDVVILHDGPNGDSRQGGTVRIREILEEFPPVFVIRGHCHWRNPLATLNNGTQVLNVDARLVILREA